MNHCEIEDTDGFASRADTDEGAEAEASTEIDAPRGLRPFQVHAIARTVAVKAFVGDLLIAWKEVCR